MKVRVRFTRLGKVRFTSHRDVARVWERAIRRAEASVNDPVSASLSAIRSTDQPFAMPSSMTLATVCRKF